MPAPLRTFMVVLWVASIAGAAVIAALAFGWMDWTAFAASGLAGLIIGIPAGIWTARRVKREDPNWPPRMSAEPDTTRHARR